MKRYFLITSFSVLAVMLALILFAKSDEINRFFSKITYLAGRQVATVGGVFTDTFSGTSSLEEAGAMSDSLSPVWWVNSGGYFNFKNGISETVQGDLPTSDYWAKLYKASNPTDTDGGIHPQNIFRLVTKGQWKNYEEEMYYKITKDELSSSPNRNVSNGLLLFNRYQNGQNLYYTGVRVDGYLVIKKKQASTYYTMAYRQIFPGKYNAVTSPNLLPKNTWIGLKSRVEDKPDGSVLITLYTDVGKTGTWTQVAQVIDDGKTFGSGVVTGPASAGIRTDFMDVQFSDYKISELDLAPPPVVVPPPATTTPPVATSTPPVVIPPVATTTPPVVVPPVVIPTSTPPVVVPPPATTTSTTTPPIATSTPDVPPVTPPDTSGGSGGGGGGGIIIPPPPDPTPPPPPDTIAPVITVLGANPAKLLKGVVYLDLGATVSDNVDTNLGVTTTGDQIDTKIVGTYTVTYVAHDNAYNYATATRQVIVSAPAPIKPPVATSTPPVSTTTPPVSTTTPPVATSTPPVVIPPVATTTPPRATSTPPRIPTSTPPVVIVIPTTTPVVSVPVPDVPVVVVDTTPNISSGSGSSGGGGGGGGGILVPLVPIVSDTPDTLIADAQAKFNTSEVTDSTTAVKTDEPTEPVVATTKSDETSSGIVLGSAPEVVVEKDLWPGIRNDDVKDVQKILATDPELYPEGLVTGFYGPKTVKAVIAFQRKYHIVSSGSADTTGLGLVGPKTRERLNALIAERNKKDVVQNPASTDISSGANSSLETPKTPQGSQPESSGGAPMSPAEKAQTVLVIQETLVSVVRQIKTLIEQVVLLKSRGL